MDRIKFFDYLTENQSLLFSHGMDNNQRTGLNIKLDVWAKWYANQHPITFLAAALGQIYHETGTKMEPVLEAFAKNRAESAIKLEEAFNEGRLAWVKQKYWLKDETNNHPVGCGDIQITHRKNYINAQNQLSEKFDIYIPLSENYDLALNPVISAHIAFSGMIDGWFRSCKLEDFKNAADFDYKGARDIVNGDAELIGPKISAYCMEFEKALIAAGADQEFGPPQAAIDWPII